MCTVIKKNRLTYNTVGKSLASERNRSSGLLVESSHVHGILCRDYMDGKSLVFLTFVAYIMDRHSCFAGFTMMPCICDLFKKSLPPSSLEGRVEKCRNSPRVCA